MGTHNICFYKEIKLITITFSSNIFLNAPIKTKVIGCMLYYCNTGENTLFSSAHVTGKYNESANTRG